MNSFDESDMREKMENGEVPIRVDFQYHRRVGYTPLHELLDDGGRGASRIYDKLDAKRNRAKNRRLLELIMRQLSKRQHEVFNLMMANYTQKEIGAEIGISQQCVAIFEARIMKKIKKVLEKCL